MGRRDESTKVWMDRAFFHPKFGCRGAGILLPLVRMLESLHGERSTKLHDTGAGDGNNEDCAEAQNLPTGKKWGAGIAATMKGAIPGWGNGNAPHSPLGSESVSRSVGISPSVRHSFGNILHHLSHANGRFQLEILCRIRPVSCDCASPRPRRCRRRVSRLFACQIPSSSHSMHRGELGFPSPAEIWFVPLFVLSLDVLFSLGFEFWRCGCCTGMLLECCWISVLDALQSMTDNSGCCLVGRNS